MEILLVAICIDLAVGNFNYTIMFNYHFDDEADSMKATHIYLFT